MDIPLYSSSGRQTGRTIPLELLLQHQRHFDISFGKRGHVQRAYFKPLESLDFRPNSRIGTIFRQPLDAGFVFAFRGIESSRSNGGLRIEQ